MSHTYEFIPKNLKCSDPTKFISRQAFSQRWDHNSLPVLVFSLPVTKSSPTGEDVYCSLQSGPADPSRALAEHFRIKNTLPHIPIFSWRHSNGLRHSRAQHSPIA
ncbi:hypothetical protein M422DRAFT_261417 [Sphaerobolus stellatus SS14]|uniref:Unplaced genomic scaffold SPHSTscaffold_105, whole genome shotgun sequence n=1 Tax=Sphaerobolus stellatus (strain SS14) TaxID=990650 RepID=A0A0C9U0I6_SPHS4|nr:hypothetical protein M422DRAFT_261417 [Sphaerobolus stellatus SS14]